MENDIPPEFHYTRKFLTSLLFNRACAIFSPMRYKQIWTQKFTFICTFFCWIMSSVVAYCMGKMDCKKLFPRIKISSAIKLPLHAEVKQLLQNRNEDDEQLFQAEARSLRSRLINVINLLDRQNTKWAKYIADQPTPAERETANQEYLAQTEQDDSFTAALDRGREALESLEAEIRDELSTATGATTPPNGDLIQPNQEDQHFLSDDLSSLNLHPNRRQVQAPTAQAQVRLPTMQMIYFDGSPQNWSAFYEMFTSTIGNQPIGDVQKLLYLLSLLQGEAKASIQGFAVSSANYPIVLQYLKDRFGQTKVLAETLQAELITMPSAKETIDSLRKTSEAIERICRQLKQLGHSDEHPLMSTTIKSKFPKQILLKIAEKEAHLGIKFTVSQLRDNLQQVISIKAEVQRSTQLLKEDSSSTSKPEKKARPTEQTRAFSVTTKAENKPKNKCFLCDAGIHWVSDCKTVSSPEDRRKRLAT
uniref:7TM GPCR serpentine receptor class x (Srx) domain-containing protein n=1 Tax=Ditylenchus dipsaci TaxID=166011 RepID=A0A915ED89_9BILA